jgi:hypothetical protein
MDRDTAAGRNSSVQSASAHRGAGRPRRAATSSHPGREDYATIVDLEARCADLDLGLADCALIVQAARRRTTRILSFDERRFRAVTPLYGDAFTLLPADA